MAPMPEFQQALLDAIEIALGQHAWMDFQHQSKEVVDPLFISAMGAAQLVKDYMNAPTPLGRSESRQCERVRREVWRNSFVGKEKRSGLKQEL